MNYAKAGVNRREVGKSHHILARRLESTFGTRRGKIGAPIYPIGHYAGLIDIGQGKVLSLHTDSVGTKALVAFAMGRFDTIGIDCVAMCANDLVCTGAEPISFLDYMAMAKPDHAIVDEVAKGLAVGAKEAGMAIVGGELAVVPELLSSQEAGFDLVGFAAGYCRKNDLILGDKTRRGDVLIGVASSGVHSNGLTLARKVLFEKYDIDDQTDLIKRTLGEELLEPTRIYVKPVRELLRKVSVHGLAHITGGGFSKLERVIGQSGFGALLDQMPVPPGIFTLIQKTGRISREEMYRTFNMGIGFVVICDKNEVERTVRIFQKYRFHAMQIGRVYEKPGIWLNGQKLNA